MWVVGVEDLDVCPSQGVGNRARRFTLVGNVGRYEGMVNGGDKLVMPLMGAGSRTAEAASKEMVAVDVKHGPHLVQ